VNLENGIIIFIYTLITGFGVRVLFHMKRANPVFWFLIFEWIIAVGTFIVVDLSLYSDILYTTLFFISLCAFLIGSLVTSNLLDIRQKYNDFFSMPIEDDAKISKVLVFLLAAFSLMVVVLYFRAVGYNLFVELALQREILDFKSARLAAYSGENYYAPGYVNQFKNILLPLCLYILCAWLWLSGRKMIFRISVMIVIPLSLYSLLGTGQRAPMVYSFLALLFGISTITRISIVRAALMSSILIFIFGIFSVVNGRMENFTIANAVLQLLSRMFINDQHEGLVAFRYLSELELSWFSDWIQGFMGIMPGHKGSYLAHELYFSDAWDRSGYCRAINRGLCLP